MLADYVLMEYIKRSGNRCLYEDFDKKFEEYRTYFFERLATKEVVKNIAEKFGVPEDVVMESLFGHYVRGDFEKVFEDMTEEERAAFESVKGKSIGFSKSSTLVLQALFEKFFR